MSKFPICRLEFGVGSMEDIRFLYRAWDDLWTLEDRGSTDCILMYVSVDDRLPDEEVSLNFNATEEVLDRFLNVLEQSGLRFSCSDLIPGFIKTCREDHDRGGLDAIGANGMTPAAGGIAEWLCHRRTWSAGGISACTPIHFFRLIF
ncbi:MAG: hypothetical protein WC600_08630 [Desulfobaccales bacterium]